MSNLHRLTKQHGALTISLLVLAAAVAAATLYGTADAGETAVQDELLIVPRGPIGPDVIVGDLHQTRHWGSVDDITAYSVGTVSCNAGDQTLLWVADSNQHPVIGQNMYRWKDGRLEQIGQSWLKHGFTALAQNACGLGCQNPGTGSLLGIGCSDPYSANLNGDQDGFGAGGLGPRFEVNAATGFFEWPYTFQGLDGDTIYKRLQVHNDDLDPAQNAGARYFVEGQYVAPDDAAAGNQNNNASYREVTVAADFDLSFAGSTQQEMAAIEAWAAVEPSVDLKPIDVPADGRMTLATRTSDNGDGTWRYEYAIHNLNSHRSAASFTVRFTPGTTLTDIGFHDVPYHSGEPYDGADWGATVDTATGNITWRIASLFIDGFESGDTSAWGGGAGEDANALRWGTMYNFWFDADRGPASDTATIGLFRPGSPASVAAGTMSPSQ